MLKLWKNRKKTVIQAVLVCKNQKLFLETISKKDHITKWVVRMGDTDVFIGEKNSAVDLFANSVDVLLEAFISE